MGTALSEIFLNLKGGIEALTVICIILLLIEQRFSKVKRKSIKKINQIRA